MSQLLCRRSILAAIVLLAMMVASPAPARAADERETIHLAAGSSVTIALTENPSTGYRWRLDEAASADLSLVDIADAGFEPGGGKLVGAPGTRRFRVVARRAIRVTIVRASSFHRLNVGSKLRKAESNLLPFAAFLSDARAR